MDTQEAKFILDTDGVKVIGVPQDTISIPRSEYDDLKEARLCLDMIAKTVGRFGVDDGVCDAVFRHFGYKTRADVEAELKEEDRNA